MFITTEGLRSCVKIVFAKEAGLAALLAELPKRDEEMQAHGGFHSHLSGPSYKGLSNLRIGGKTDGTSSVSLYALHTERDEYFMRVLYDNFGTGTVTCTRREDGVMNAELLFQTRNRRQLREPLADLDIFIRIYTPVHDMHTRMSEVPPSRIEKAANYVGDVLRKVDPLGGRNEITPF